MWERTSSGGLVGRGGAGKETVVVDAAVVVACDVVVTVAVTVTVAPAFPSPWLSLCWAPAKRPMKTELRSRKMRVAMSRTFVNGDNGSCTIAARVSMNEGSSSWSAGAPSGCETF